MRFHSRHFRKDCASSGGVEVVGGTGHDVITLVSALGSATSMYSSGSSFGPVVLAQICRSAVWDGEGRMG